MPYRQPVDNVGISGISSAASILLITSTVHYNRVLQGTFSGGIKRSHVENIIPLHLSDELQTLKTGRLLEIRRHGTGLGTGGKKILLRVDFYSTRRESQSTTLVKREKFA